MEQKYGNNSIDLQTLREFVPLIFHSTHSLNAKMQDYFNPASYCYSLFPKKSFKACSYLIRTIVHHLKRITST